MEALAEMINTMRPWCALDKLPVRFLKEAAHSVCNEFLTPDCPGLFQIKTSVRSLLKTYSLDIKSLDNFRTFSRLPFLARVLEKIVARQSIAVWNRNEPQHRDRTVFHCFHLIPNPGVRMRLWRVKLSSKVTDHDLLFKDSPSAQPLFLLTPFIAGALVNTSKVCPG